MSLDPFTLKRLTRSIEEFRDRTGQLPALKDLLASGFTREQVDDAIQAKAIERFYVTLTNGIIVKAYKISSS